MLMCLFLLNHSREARHSRICLWHPPTIWNAICSEEGEVDFFLADAAAEAGRSVEGRGGGTDPQRGEAAIRAAALLLEAGGRRTGGWGGGGGAAGGGGIGGAQAAAAAGRTRRAAGLRLAAPGDHSYRG